MVHGVDACWRVTSGEQDPATVERLLRSLPDWFGMPAANAEYVAAADELPTYLARPAQNAEGGHGDPVGVLLARRHFAEAAEIHLLAVEPSLHRNGVGRALVAAFEADLLADGCKVLQVKTLGPSRPHAGYERTRRFYRSVGFWPLEEVELWDGDNPCLIMVKELAPMSI
jgi:GNAT superfamily N-acetyltransferase